MTDLTNVKSVTCPQARAVKGRRKNLNRIWSGKEWKERKAAFLKANPLCAMHNECGITIPAVVPHHPYRPSYKGHYTDLELSGCVAYCARCHFAIHKGMRLCRSCGEHYHPWDAEMCRYCFDRKNPEVVAAREIYANAQEVKAKAAKQERNAKARAAKRRHPCTYHRIGGKCGKSAIGSRCTYAPTKAMSGCVDAVAKKREAVHG